MKRTRNKYTLLLAGAFLAGLSATAFDGVTNTIPDGTSYDELDIGKFLPNTLINIESNSTVTVSDFTRLGKNDSSTNNTLLVEDGSSLLIGSLAAPVNDGIVIGNSEGDALIIKNASTAVSSTLTMGASENETSKISIKGDDSILIINQDATIGALGDGNQVNVSDGAIFEVSGELNVGSTNTVDNRISVDSESTLSVSSLDKINIAENNDIVINGTLQAKGDVSTSAIVDTKVTMNSGSQILVDDTLKGSIEGGYAVVLNDSATWDTNDNDARIGFSTSDNSLTINNSSEITLTNIVTVGEESNQNGLNIQDDAILTATTVNIGDSGSYNTLNIEDDAELSMTNGTLTAGINGAANSNTINLKDDGSLNVTSMTIGSRGKFNKFDQTGGDATVFGNLIVGEKSGADGNSISISGGSTLSVSNLIVGADQNEGNTANVSGEDTLLHIDENLTIGSATSSNNTVTVENNGTLFIGSQTNIVMGVGSNNTLKVTTGTLKTEGWDFDLQTGLATNIVFDTGSTLHLLGELKGTNMVEGGWNVVLDGTNSSWNTTTNMYVGHESDQNSLTLTNGASASTSTNLHIGYGDSADNIVTVAGAGSTLNIGNDLFIGTEVDDNTQSLSDNTLSLINGAHVFVENNAYVYRGATLKIDSKSQVTVAGDYEQDKYSTLSIGISSNATPPNLEVAGNAELASGTTIEVYDNGIGDDTNVVQNIVKAGTLTIGGQTASTGLLFDNITIETNLLLNFTATVSNGTDNAYIVLDNFIKRSLTEAAGLDGMLADVADEIEDMAKADSDLAKDMLKTFSGMDADEANKAMDDYYGEKGSSAPMNNVVNQSIGGIASELTVRGDNTRARTDDSAPAPVGAEGPHMQGQELQGWVAGYGSWGSKGASDGYNGYDANLSGFIIGADLAVSQNILVGLAGGSNSGSVDKENGGSGDTKTSFGAVYASVGTQDWFFDGSIIYGGSEIDQKLGDVFDTTASYDAQNLAFYFGGGKEITGSHLIITPQASLLANYYKQDAYDEESNNAVGRSVDSFDALYIQSSLGCSLGFYTAMGNTIFKPELRAHWLHEFNASEESLPYRLIGGNGTPYAMSLQAPEEDIIRLGAGIAAKMSDYLELRVDLDTQQASSYSDFTLLGSLRYQF